VYYITAKDGRVQETVGLSGVTNAMMRVIIPVQQLNILRFLGDRGRTVVIF